MATPIVFWFGILDLGLWILGFGFWTLGIGVWDFEFRTLDLGCGCHLYVRFWISGL